MLHRLCFSKKSTGLLAGITLLVFLMAGCGTPATIFHTISATSTSVPLAATATEPPPSETALPPTSAATPVPPTDTATPMPPTHTAAPEPPTPPPTATELPNTITDSFGVPMILIPAGEFTMGHNDNQAVAAPAHKVYLDTFYIDKYEVTNALYLECAEAGVCTTGGNVLLRRTDLTQHPVMDVTWYNAQTYCEWRSDGNRHGSLPTEAQWEKAARGTDERLYPWGNEPVTCDRARYTECGVSTSAVGEHPTGASFYGVEDMAGNVWEWVFDWYDNDYYKNSPYENPTGPERETGWKSERGGAWFYQAELQTAVWRNQAPPTAHYLYVGFRCAVTP